MPRALRLLVQPRSSRSGGGGGNVVVAVVAAAGSLLASKRIELAVYLRAVMRKPNEHANERLRGRRWAIDGGNGNTDISRPLSRLVWCVARQGVIYVSWLKLQ